MEWILAAGALFTAGLVQGCVGFGFALIAAPVLLLSIPPVSLVPLLVMQSTPNTFLIAIDGRAHIRPGLVLSLAAGAMIGLPLGIHTLVSIPPYLVKAGVGLFVMIFSVVLLTGWKKILPERPATLIPVGMFSGFLGGLCGISGPPVILFLANQQTNKQVFRANTATYFFFLNCMAIILLSRKGLFSTSLLLEGCSLFPVMLCGSWLGIQLSHRISESVFRRITIVGILFMGFLLVLTSLGLRIHSPA